MTTRHPDEETSFRDLKNFYADDMAVEPAVVSPPKLRPVADLESILEEIDANADRS